MPNKKLGPSMKTAIHYPVLSDATMDSFLVLDTVIGTGRAFHIVKHVEVLDAKKPVQVDTVFDTVTHPDPDKPNRKPKPKPLLNVSIDAIYLEVDERHYHVLGKSRVVEDTDEFQESSFIFHAVPCEQPHTTAYVSGYVLSQFNKKTRVVDNVKFVLTSTGLNNKKGDLVFSNFPEIRVKLIGYDLLVVSLTHLFAQE